MTTTRSPFSQLISTINSTTKKQQSSKPVINPIRISTDLPCIADKDDGKLPGPTYKDNDINIIRDILAHFVPVELADAIIDMAEIWPWIAVSRNAFTSCYSALEAPDKKAQWCYLISPEIPHLMSNNMSVPTTVKMVKFFIKTYSSSWGRRSDHASKEAQGYETWFETSILKKDGSNAVASYDDNKRSNDWYASMAAPHPKYLNFIRDAQFEGSPVDNPFDEQPRWHVTDCPASESNQWHEVVWRSDDSNTGAGSGSEFVNALSIGDRVVLMARAQSPGWIDTVFNVKMEIYYAFSSSYL